MNKVDLFLDLGKKKKGEILELLENAYFEMNSNQRQTVKLTNFLNVSRACGYSIVLEKNGKKICL